jgi:hypothetical protein
MSQRVCPAIDLGAEGERVMASVGDGEAIPLREFRRFANGLVHPGDSIGWNHLRLWGEIQTGLGWTAAQDWSKAGPARHCAIGVSRLASKPEKEGELPGIEGQRTC